jgi:uncharacterized damage-inducible protein DinB
MNRDTFISMLDFQAWADARILRAAELVADGEYFRDRAMGVGSIHDLLVHAMATQAMWLRRFKGDSGCSVEDARKYPARRDVVKQWPIVHSQLSEFVGAQTVSTLRGIVCYQSAAAREYYFPLDRLLMHMLDESTYHRGQLNLMIRSAGGKPARASHRNYLESISCRSER